MNNKLYVGNLAYKVRNNELLEFFSQFGNVEDAVVIMDRATNRSKGFGFVTFTNEEDAQKALESANGQDLMGRALKVSIARPKPVRE